MDEIVHWPAFTMKQNLEGSKKVQTIHTTKILYEKYFLLDKITILRYFYIAIYKSIQCFVGDMVPGRKNNHSLRRI